MIDRWSPLKKVATGSLSLNTKVFTAEDAEIAERKRTVSPCPIRTLRLNSYLGHEGSEYLLNTKKAKGRDGPIQLKLCFLCCLGV